MRDTTFASALSRRAKEDVAWRVAAARDAACNAGRARLSLHFFAENDRLCRFVQAHYVAGRRAVERAANDGPLATDPAARCRAWAAGASSAWRAPPRRCRCSRPRRRWRTRPRA